MVSKKILTSGLFFAFMFASSSSVLAQQSQPSTPKPSSVAPQRQVAPAELEKFANAIKQLQVIQQETMKEMVQVVQSEDLSEQRFVQIYQAQQNPNAQPTPKITREEQQNFEQASVKIRDIQQKNQPKMEKAVTDAGLDIQRFNQISATVRQNPALQKQVQQMIRS